MKLELVPEVGDIVYLNSDFDRSTPMTVEAIWYCDVRDTTVLNVVWTDYGDIKRDDFDIRVLSYSDLD